MKHLKLFEAFDKDDKSEPWWKEFTKYQLSSYPVNIPKEDVTIDLSGDIDTHPVLTWHSPKTGKKIYAYTKARMDAQKEQKYSRIENLSDEKVDNIIAATHTDISSPMANDKTKDAAAVVCIIAHTGLRPGSRMGFEETKNRGVLTLSPENVSINGPLIKLNFVGKSYKENVAEINDGVLANYLESKLKSGKDFLFDISKDKVDDYYKNALGMKKFKIKDLRTFIAGKIAKWFLTNDPTSPPPVPEDPKKIKKLVKTKLKKAFEYVSQKLNNTPAMAKGSYVNPDIITDWLGTIGVKPAIISEEVEQPSQPAEFVGNAPVYDLPDWWEDDDMELIKK